MAQICMLSSKGTMDPPQIAQMANSPQIGLITDPLRVRGEKMEAGARRQWGVRAEIFPGILCDSKQIFFFFLAQHRPTGSRKGKLAQGAWLYGHVHNMC